MTSSSSAASSLHITITSNPSSSTITNNTNANNPKPHHPHHQQHPSSARPGSNNNSSGGGGGGSSSTNQACAACKYQRRKCNPDCPLAPYFPADQQRRFLHAHRLFGVSNILKTLRRIKPELCDAAMNALIYQAEMRAIDPVGGCCRIILDLENTFELESAELAALLHHLELCRQAAAAASGVPPPDVMDAADLDLDLEVTSSNHQPSLAMDAVVDIDTPYVGQEAIRDNNSDHGNNNTSPQEQGEQQQQQQLYDYFYYETTNGGAGEDASSNKPGSVDINVDVMQQFEYDSGCDAIDDHSHKLVQLAPMISSGGLGQHQLEEENYGQIDQKEYEMKVASFVDAFDVNADIAAGVKEELDQDQADANNNMALAEASQLAESSHCRLGLGFSSL